MGYIVFRLSESAKPLIRSNPKVFLSINSLKSKPFPLSPIFNSSAFSVIFLRLIFTSKLVPVSAACLIEFKSTSETI